MNSYYNVSFNWWLCSVVSSLAALLTLLYYYSTSTYDRLRKQNVPHLPPVPLFGNVFRMMACMETMRDSFDRVYRTFSNHKICGFYQMRIPYLMIRDPELIYMITNKDFAYFTDRGFKFDPATNIIGRSLASTEGQKWKTMRKTLSVGFTSAKLKSMVNEMAECSDQLIKWIDDKSKGTDGIEVSHITKNFARDVIGTCAFGLKLDNLGENNSEFQKKAELLIGNTDLKTVLKYVAALMFPSFFNFLKIPIISQDVTNYFHSMFSDVMEHRKNSNVVKHDLTQTLINARQKLVLSSDNSEVDDKDKFIDLDIIANAMLLFAAGGETVSTTTALCIHELALNKDIQNRLRDEINTANAKYGGQYTDEFLMNLPYLKMVIDETHRKYSITTMILRVATQNYNVPGMQSFTIKKGQLILLPMSSIHHDPLYYPEPQKFDPERFSKKEILKRPNGTFFPFGIGPRNCIGMGFANMELKLILSKVIPKFELLPCEKTDYSMEIKKRFGVLSSKNGVWIKFRPIRN